LGHGVTSRDSQINEGESEGPSPNSGAIARALNGHPMMRFFASTTAAVVTSAVLGRVVRGQGLKLGKKIQETKTYSRRTRTELQDMSMIVLTHTVDWSMNLQMEL